MRLGEVPEGWEAAMQMPVLRLDVDFITQKPLELHCLNGPMFRGTFGTALRHLYGKGGAYEALLDSGNDETRPYRIVSPYRGRMKLPKQALFGFGLDLFGPACDFWPQILPAFVVMAHLGFGEQRSQAKLHAVTAPLPGGAERLVVRAFNEEAKLEPSPLWKLLPPLGERLNWVGPLRLGARGPAGLPTLGLTAARIQQRLSRLAGIELPAVDLPGEEWEWVDPFVVNEARRSRRQGQLKLSGVIGAVRLPSALDLRVRTLLQVACITGVGHLAVMGMGDCRAE